MLMPERRFSAGPGYRYGFGGKESETDINEGSLDFRARIFDSSIGYWSSVDPLSQKYPSLSPYNYCNSSPIINRDIDGRGWIISVTTDKFGNRTVLSKTNGRDGE
ncbi:MAG: hypothetical protein EOP04_02675 [Proteobacteria bacterium]|nr:MAG: hypothetical protein EOP04_02675 [Pseudomonadota bacterium]